MPMCAEGSGPPLLAQARAFEIHGVRVAVDGDAVMIAAVETRFARFPRVAPATADLTVTYTMMAGDARRDVPPPPRTARTIYRSPGGDIVCYDATGDRLFITRGADLHLLYEPARRRATVVVVRQPAVASRLPTHALFTLVLMEAVRRHGRYCVHAAAVARDGHGLVFPGDSGSGKSTLALALAHAGYGFPADDLVFLTHDEHGPRLLACPEPADVTPRTARLFPPLADVLLAPPPAGRPK